MIDSNTGSGACASRIRRSRRGWRWTARLLPAVLACAFAGVGQAQTIYRGGLDDAVGELVRTLVNEARLHDKRVLVKSEDFFEMGTGLRLDLSERLKGMSVAELTGRGVSVALEGSDEDAVRVLHGRWRRMPDGHLYLELFVAERVTEGDPTALKSAKGFVPIDESIREAIEATREDWGRLLVRRLEKGVRDRNKRKVLLQPITIEGDGAQGGRLEQFLTNWLGNALVGSRLFTLVEPPPGVVVETDGKLHVAATVHEGHVEVGLRVLDNQYRRVTFATVELERNLFPSGVVGTGDGDGDDVPVVTGGQPVPGGGEATDARLAQCAGHVGAKRRADAVKCYAHVLKEAPGDKGALAGLEGLRGTRFRDCLKCPELVVVPSGSFMMGAPPGESGRGDDEGPMHEVTIGYPIAVGVYEVTFGEWDACADGGGCGGYQPDDEGWGGGNHPVINVNWNNAKAYVRWLSRKTGEEYRLLSEAEWEYVARAGTTTPFHTGATISTERANYNGNHTYGSSRKGRYIRKTVEVGSFPANRLGLHDVHGNVWEWVEDCYSDGYEGAPTDGSAWEWNCGRRVLRGGSWYGGPGYLRSAYRNWSTTSLRDDDAGIRVARTLAP